MFRKKGDPVMDGSCGLPMRFTGCTFLREPAVPGHDNVAGAAACDQSVAACLH